MIRRLVGFLVLVIVGTIGAADEPVDKVPFRMDRPVAASYELHLVTSRYLSAITDQWLLSAPTANPAMIDMFRDRDRKPYRQMEPWAGEFAGKYLTSAVQIHRLTHSAQLKDAISRFVKEFTSLQADDGYLGPWPKEVRLTGKAPNAGSQTTWDAWGHYHAMLGLLLWYEDSKDESAVNAARKIGDLLCNKFLGNKIAASRRHRFDGNEPRSLPQPLSSLSRHQGAEVSRARQTNRRRRVRRERCQGETTRR